MKIETGDDQKIDMCVSNSYEHRSIGGARYQVPVAKKLAPTGTRGRGEHRISFLKKKSRHTK